MRRSTSLFDTKYWIFWRTNNNFPLTLLLQTTEITWKSLIRCSETTGVQFAVPLKLYTCWRHFGGLNSHKSELSTKLLSCCEMCVNLLHRTYLTLMVGASNAVLPSRALILIPYIPLIFKHTLLQVILQTKIMTEEEVVPEKCQGWGS